MKSRNGKCASSVARCSRHCTSVTPLTGSSQRVLPWSAAGRSAACSAVPPLREMKRKFSSCSQYQSDVSSVRLRKRASLSRSAASASASLRFMLWVPQPAGKPGWPVRTESVRRGAAVRRLFACKLHACGGPPARAGLLRRGVAGGELFERQIALLVLVELVELGCDGRQARCFFFRQLAVVVGVGAGERAFGGGLALGRCIGRHLGLGAGAEGEAGEQCGRESAASQSRA